MTSLGVSIFLLIFKLNVKSVKFRINNIIEWIDFIKNNKSEKKKKTPRIHSISIDSIYFNNTKQLNREIKEKMMITLCFQKEKKNFII